MNRGSLDMIMGRLRNQNPIEIKNFFKAITVQILMGLHYLHKHLKVAHRFVDSSHILLNDDGASNYAVSE